MADWTFLRCFCSLINVTAYGANKCFLHNALNNLLYNLINFSDAKIGKWFDMQGFLTKKDDKFNTLLCNFYKISS